MNPGYYWFKPMCYPIEVTDDGQYLSMYGESVSGHIARDALDPASTKDLILFGEPFDKSKVISNFVAWASSEDAEDWHHATNEDDAIGQAMDYDLNEIWICDSPTPADPRDVTPCGHTLIDNMLERCDDDNSMFYAGHRTHGGWLDNVTDEQRKTLEDVVTSAICRWLNAQGHWPSGFVVSGYKARRVAVPREGA